MAERELYSPRKMQLDPHGTATYDDFNAARESGGLMRKRFDINVREEAGHAEPWIGVLIGAAGAIALGIGAATDMGWLAIVGGVAAAVGLAASFAINHATVEKGMYGRLDKLDGNK